MTTRVDILRHNLSCSLLVVLMERSFEKKLSKNTEYVCLRTECELEYAFQLNDFQYRDQQSNVIFAV